MLGVRRRRQPGGHRDGLRRRGRISACRCSTACRNWWTRACCARCERPGGRRRVTRCWRRSASSRPSAWTGMPEAGRVRGRMRPLSWPWPRTPAARMTGRAKKEWLERLDIEHNNIRAALDWYREHDPPAALRLAAAMSAFWSLRGHYTEGRQRLGELLGLVPDDEHDASQRPERRRLAGHRPGRLRRSRPPARREHRAEPLRWTTRSARASPPCTSAAASCPACGSRRRRAGRRAGRRRC